MPDEITQTIISTVPGIRQGPGNGGGHLGTPPAITGLDRDDVNKPRLVCYLAQSRRSPSGYFLVFIISVSRSRVLSQASVFSVSTLLSLSHKLQEKALESLQASKIYGFFCMFGLNNLMEVTVKLEPFGKQRSHWKDFQNVHSQAESSIFPGENSLPFATVIL